MPTKTTVIDISYTENLGKRQNETKKTTLLASISSHFVNPGCRRKYDFKLIKILLVFMAFTFVLSETIFSKKVLTETITSALESDQRRFCFEHT